MPLNALNTCDQRLVAALMAVAFTGVGCSGSGGAERGQGQEFNGAMTILVGQWGEGTLLGLATWSEASFRIDSEEVVPGVGDCLDPHAVFGSHFFNPIFEAGQAVDAGDAISLASSDVALTFFPSGPDALILPNLYGVLGTDLEMSPASAFTIASSGGADLPPFVGALVSPSGLVVTDPQTGPGSVTIDLSLGLPIAWVSTGGIGLVHVSLSQESLTGEVRTRICTFADTGSAVIPASDLQGFSESRAELSIGKTSVGAFTSGAGGLTYTQFTVLHRWDADLVEGQ